MVWYVYLFVFAVVGGVIVFCVVVVVFVALGLVCFLGGSWGWGWGVFLLFDFRLHFRLLWVCSLVKSVTTFNIIL